MPLTVPYAPNQSYVPNGRLVDLIRLQGQDAARAAEQRGQNSANLWNTVGQSIQQGVGAVSQAIQEAPKLALQRQAVQDAQNLHAGQSQLDTLMQGDPLSADQEGPRQESYLGADGLWDIPKLTQALGKSGKGHLAPELLKPAEAMNESITKHQASVQQAATTKTLVLGDSAAGALKLVQLGVPIEQAIDFAAQAGLASKSITPQEIAQFKSRIAPLPPDQQQAALTTFMDAAAKLDKGETLADKAQHYDRYGRMSAENVGEAPAPSKARFAAVLSDPKSTPEQRDAAQKALDAMTPKPTVSLQSKSVLLDGKPAEVVFNPSNGHYQDSSGADISSRVKPIPSAATVSINANKLTDAALDQAAQKYLDSGVLPAGMGGMAQRTAIQNRAAELDPKAALARNAATFKADSANLTNLQRTEGTLSAFESTAGKNLDQFLTLADKIPDTGVPWLNRPLRELNASIVGSENMAAINAARDVALREIARVTNDPKLSGALTDSARAEVLGLSPKNATLPQIKAVAKVLKQDMANVHAGLNEQIDAVKAAIGSSAPKSGTPKEGDVKPIDGFPGTEQTFKGGKWIRTK